MQQEDEKTHVVTLLSWMKGRDVSVVENGNKIPCWRVSDSDLNRVGSGPAHALSSVIVTIAT
jgi:hypothetical protein